MELLGNNLSQLRRSQARNQFPVSVTAALGIEMLGAIEVLHETGFLHRDIKPVGLFLSFFFFFLRAKSLNFFLSLFFFLFLCPSQISP